MSNSGKYLEAITSSVEKCLITNKDNTTIKRNIKVLDRDDVEREIDVYVETKVNHKVLKYAIECKELSGNSKVEIKDVSDFYDKISNQGMKGIIITTTNFRKNAIKKAKNLNIDAYRIIDNPNASIESYTLIHKRHSIDKLIFSSSNNKDLKNTTLDFIYINEEKKCVNTLSYINSDILPKVNHYINTNRDTFYKNLIEFNEKGFKIIPNKIETDSILANLKFVFFKYNDEYFPIEGCQFDCRFWIEYLEEDKPSSFQYFDIFNNVSVANFLTRSIEIESGIKGHINIVENEDDIKFDFVTEDPNNQGNIKTYDFG
ncbi:MAG TPA: restriction endonuclease, partial [Saprospiraceae bacterium]|nr:restriction endonuclease [Saprospiraceae bacterium]